MKQTLTRVAIAIAIVGGMWALVTFIPNETSVMNERSDNVITKEVEVTPEVEDVDVLDAAKAELERINLELDAEETRILEDQAAARAEYEAKSAEYEARLERIRETRTSFR